MKWLEIIELRTVQMDPPDLRQQVAYWVNEMKEVQGIAIYFNLRVETDWIIQLHHESEKVALRGSEFGRRLKERLKRSGLVNHSIWVEKSPKND
jgi:hypothetical protein